MNDKGKYFEEIVELIERSINPGSKVERDVQMPILSSKEGNTTQCDIVITSGEKPRETITIVEVQNRSRKPDPNDVRGWVGKLDEIGAQHLICVSKKGFSKSVKEAARLTGDKVRLIKLSKVSKDKIPLDSFKMHASYQEFGLDEILNNSFDISGDDLTVFGLNEDDLGLKELSSGKKIFSYDKKNLLSLEDICANKVTILNTDESGIDTVRIDHNTSFYLYTHNVFISLDLYLEFKWTKTFTEIPVDFLSYEQDDYGVLVWLVQGSLKTWNGIISFRIPAKKFQNGYSIKEYWIDKPENVKLIFKPLLKK